MVPILEPAQYPFIVVYALTLMLMLGLPTGFLALAVFFVLERVTQGRVRDFLPLAATVILLLVTLLFFTGAQAPASYERFGLVIILTSFLLNAMVILAPFPFMRDPVRDYSPYPLILIASLVTFFLLTAFGLVGGETRITPGNGIWMQIEVVMRIAAMFIIAALVYGAAGIVGKRARSGQDDRKSPRT